MHQHDPAEHELRIEGMHCTGCALGVENHLRRLGLRDAAVDYATSSANFSENANNLPLPAIVSEIEKLGYKVLPAGRAPREKEPFFSRIETKFFFCLIFTAPLLMHMFLPYHLLHDEIFQLVMAIPVFAVGVLHFGKSAWRSSLSGTMNMDVLIFLGSSAAFIYSLIGTVFGLGPSYQFYETSASIITLVLLGNLIENRSVKKTTSAIEELSRMQTGRARIIRTGAQGETVEETDSAAVKAGDMLLVNTGDRIPCDSEVIWGSGTVDESMLTGESSPVEKEPGAKAIGGTVVAAGSLKLRAQAVGEATVLASIIKLVREAQRSKPSIQRLSDRISSVFVPAVLIFAGLTLAVSLVLGLDTPRALLNSIAVLVIACPCAMGLATPTAVMVGLGRAVKEGILIRGADTIEKVAQVRSVAFDKTGTLTTGNFAVSGLKAEGAEQSEVESAIAGIERHSSHPIAKSLAAHFSKSREMRFVDIEELRGLGMKARDESGNEYMLGSYNLVSHLTADSSRSVYLVKNGKLIAALDIRDEIKPNAKSAIERLKGLGLDVFLVSGDSEQKCNEVARAVGIEKVFARQLPEQKLKTIEELQRSHNAAFVGDGINDAPALAKAAVGISLSNASEAAIQSAQVVLLNGNLDHLVSAFHITRKTLRTIKQNLFWAFFYNVLAIPVAAVGLLTPTVAAFTMGFSDVIVIGNSLRLRGYRPGD